jgi:hypothetical protein
MNLKLRITPVLAATLAATAALGVATVATPASGNETNACQAKVAGVHYVRPADSQPCASSERAVQSDPSLVIK